MYDYFILVTLQLAVSQVTISIFHRLEQVSSNEHVGSLAENLLEALCTNKRVAELIEEARQHTRSEKKRLAMAMRERQLGALGMQTNDKGQVTASGTILQQMEDLGDETGLICVICREGYKFKPNMVKIMLYYFIIYKEHYIYQKLAEKVCNFTSRLISNQFFLAEIL